MTASPGVLNVLFLCTGNSARSIMAEALMNYPAVGGGKFRAFSAGSHPKGTVNPLALEALRRHQIPADGLRSKSWGEFAGPGAPQMHFVFTVCDQAAAEQCPLWPGQPMTAQWGVPDPAAVTGSDADKQRAFREALLVLRRRIELFASLPLDKLTRLALQERLDQIGRETSARDQRDGQTQPVRQKQLIAHRGASAYAPEHTLAAYRLAVEQGADYVEQDLSATKDGVLICLHDDSLERTTNVDEVFPDRGDVDPAGRRRWLAVDFTLAEIKRLDAGRWFDARFAGEEVPTWEEAVATVGTTAGLCPELKTPALYRSRGVDMARLFVDSVRRLGLTSRREGTLIVQSFDDLPLRELAKELPAVPRTLLIEARDGARWLSNAGLIEAAQFATGIGPSKLLLDGRPEVVAAAHQAGLTVTPYTFTSKAPAPRFPDVRDEMRYYLVDLGVDAVFTDNPDRFPRRTVR